MDSKLYQDYLHILKKELVPARNRLLLPTLLQNAGKHWEYSRKRWKHCAAGTSLKMSRE